MPARKVTHLPKQDNYCDCGLFTLTYIHFFTFQAPESVEIERLESMGGQLLGATLSFASPPFLFLVVEAGIQFLQFHMAGFWDRKRGKCGAVADRLLLLDADDEGNFPLILTRHWFSPHNAGNLRRHIRFLLLGLFIEQATDKDAAAVQEAIVEMGELQHQPVSQMSAPFLPLTTVSIAVCWDLNQERCSLPWSPNISSSTILCKKTAW